MVDSGFDIDPAHVHCAGSPCWHLWCLDRLGGWGHGPHLHMLEKLLEMLWARRLHQPILKVLFQQVEVGVVLLLGCLGNRLDVRLGLLLGNELSDFC